MAHIIKEYTQNGYTVTKKTYAGVTLAKNSKRIILINVFGRVEKHVLDLSI